jgi:hypothetical protein
LKKRPDRSTQNRSCKFKTAGLKPLDHSGRKSKRQAAHNRRTQRGPEFTKLPIYSITKFICSFHAATCAQNAFTINHFIAPRFAFHSLLTDCTLPADAWRYILRFVRQSVTHGQAF